MPIPVNISASRGSAILGLSNWSTQVEVWLKIKESREPGFCAKNNYELPVFEESPVLRWGKAFETAVIELAEKKQEKEITLREKFCAAGYSNLSSKESLIKKDAKITCHLDGNYKHSLIQDSDLHEGKTTSYFYYKDNFGEPGTDKVPIDYQIQGQHQMICTGAKKVILSVLVFPKRVEEWEENGYIPMELKSGVWVITNDKTGTNFHPNYWAEPLADMGYFHQYEINAHPELQGLMLDHYNDFWNDHILTDVAPEAVSYDDIKKLVRNPVGTIVADEKIETLMEEYKNIKSEIGGTGSLAKRAERIKVQVLNWMNETEKIEDYNEVDSQKWILKDRAGKKIASYGQNKKGSFIFR